MTALVAAFNTAWINCIETPGPCHDGILGTHAPAPTQYLATATAAPAAARALVKRVAELAARDERPGHASESERRVRYGVFLALFLMVFIAVFANLFMGVKIYRAVQRKKRDAWMELRKRDLEGNEERS